MLRTLTLLLSALSLFIGGLSCSVKKEMPRPDGTLKVLSYNIHHGNPPSVVGKIDLNAIAAVINREAPDLVGLQEVDRFTKRSGDIDEAKVLAKKTGMHFLFFKAIDHDGGEYGLAILSRFPIRSPNLIRLPQAIKAEDRILSYVTVTVAGQGPIVFANTHLDATKNDSNRIVQMKMILATLKDIKSPVILCGDLNSEASGEPITLLDKQFDRSCKLNCAATIPQDVPVKTIDYVALRNKSWKVKRHQVIAEIYASDHRPLAVTYQLSDKF